MKKRLFSILTALSLCLTLLPATALAADTPADIADEYNVDGVTYYKVNSDHFDDSSKQFIQDMLSGWTLDSRHSTAALWQELAACIQSDYGNHAGGKYNDNLNYVLTWGMPYYYANSANSGNRIDLLDDFVRSDSYGGDSYRIRYSGLTYANSVSAAATAMEGKVFDGYDDAGGTRNASSAVAQNTTLRDDTDPDDVFWMLTGVYKTSGPYKKGHYQALGVLFSDVTITTILPEDSGNFYQSSESDPKVGSKTYASHVKNMTSTSVNAQQEFSNTTSTTATSSISNSKSYGFEEGLEVGFEKKLLVGTLHANLSFTASQTIESGWSEEKSLSDEQTTSYNVSVELPAYTNVMMKQNTSEVTTTTKYNCPVALNFTVTMVEYTLDPNDNSAKCQTKVLATFGSNARKDLKQRGVIDVSLTDPDGIDWNTLYYNASGLQDNVKKYLSATAPMSSAGATFTVVDDAVTSEISGLAPIYALSDIKTANDIMEYTLSSGKYLYVDNIELNGLNRQNAAYYGFNPDKGHWILVDKDGNELTDSPTDSPIATLETNSVTGHTKLVAGQTAGTVYLKYLIDEDVYATAANPTAYTTNADLDSTAVIEVNVSKQPFKGTIGISGTLTGIVGDSAKSIEGTDGLTATVEDETGKEISRPVVWEAKELESKGIKVEGNRISFTKEGTFHVRAMTEDIYSDWYEVTALPARKLDKIQIPETATFDYKNQKTLDLSGLQVQYKDQYGADWTTIPTLTWACEDEGTEIENGVLKVPSAGVYTVTASADGITSNTLTVTVTDSTPKITSLTPAEKSLSSSGGSVEFVITGVNLSDGITVQVADGSITASTTGSDTEQKATLEFPANTDTGSAKTYTVTNSLDNTKTAVVTVAKKPTGGGGGGGGAAGGGGGAAGGGGGAAGGITAYTITVEDTGNGKVTANSKTAAKDDTVTLTVAPDKGYTLETLLVTDQKGGKLELKDKGDGKYTFTMPASNVTVKATFMEDNSMLNFFVDVPANAYYYDAVLWAAENSITGGTDATHFSPDATCTRAQAVTFLWRAAGSPAPESSAMPFTDVANGTYYHDAVLWAAENGITGGTDATHFSPDATCTRAQIVTFLWRAQSSPAAGAANPFNDVAADAYYADAVLWAVENGVTNGTSDTMFSPDEDCTRAQIVSFLWRTLAE